jgi:hypothetical protein
MGMEMRMRLTMFVETSQAQARSRRGTFPAKAALYAPHTNEHDTVLLFQHRLKSTLEKQDVKVETGLRPGMMAKLWKMRRMLNRTYERDTFQNDLITAILTIHDMHLRLKTISDYFRRNPEGAVMELHAMDESIPASTSRLSQRDLRELLIISGTNLLICRDALSSFSGSLSDALKREDDIQTEISQFLFEKEAQEKARETLASTKADIEETCNFSANDSLREAEELVSLLSPYRKRIMIIEIPSETVPLPPTHSAYPLFFDEKGRVVSTSCFEEAYGSCTRKSTGFSEKDVQAVASQLKVC